MWIAHLRDGEHQLPVVGWDGYYVTDHGRVFSFKHQGFRTSTIELDQEPAELKLTVARVGYRRRAIPICNLRNGRANRLVRPVGLIVLRAFVGPRPSRAVMCHANDNPFDNRLDNLRYDTQAANAADAIRNGRMPWGEEHCKALLTNAQAAEIIASADSITALAQTYGVSRDVIEYIRRGQTYRHLPRYAET